MTQQKRRSPWLAGIGNLLYAPLGHVYAGQAWRGVLICAAFISITLVALCAVAHTVGRTGLLLTALVLVAAPLFVIVDAALVARREGGAYQLKWYNRWHFYLLTAVLAWGTTQAMMHSIQAFIVQAYYIPSSAMRPTLLVNDRLVVDKLAYRWQSPARLDVVVFRAPRNGITGVPVSPDENDFIKRIIALPGETVQVLPDAVTVDDKRAVQFLDEYSLDPGSSFLGAKPRGLAIEKELTPEIQADVLTINKEPRVAVTPSGKAEYRDGQLRVDGQKLVYVGGPSAYRTDSDLSSLGAEPGVEGTVYYAAQESERPALIVLKGKQLALRPGHVTVNRQPLKEPYILHSMRYEMPAYKVPAGYYFVMGDNRNDSNDSHAWGPLARERIIGVARTIWWPGDDGTGVRWGRVGQPLD